MAAKLEQLRDGLLSREEASDWAQRWYLHEGDDVEIDDWGVWDALGTLYGCDTRIDPERYLYGQEDFEAGSRTSLRRLSRKSPRKMVWTHARVS